MGEWPSLVRSPTLLSKVVQQSLTVSAITDCLGHQLFRLVLAGQGRKGPVRWGRWHRMRAVENACVEWLHQYTCGVYGIALELAQLAGMVCTHTNIGS